MKRVVLFITVILLLSIACFSADYDGYIVRIKQNTVENMTDRSLFADRAFLMSEIDDSEIVELIVDEIDSVSEIVAEDMLLKADDENALDELVSLGIVESFEKNVFLELHGYDYSANPEYMNQKWYLDAINADFAWNAGIFGADTRVAVVDSGVNPHNDIKKNLAEGRNYISGEDVKNTTDIKGHGTSVASIIAAQCDNLSTIGISFKAVIVPLKVTNASEVPLDRIISAIDDAVNEFDCDVINLSFGMEKESDELRRAIKRAIDKNAIVVASAGNGGNAGYAYPAAYDEVISVANAEKYNSSLRVAASSQRNNMVDITAPGTGITAHNLYGGVSQVNGTSFSAPMVSGAAALAKSINPAISQSQFQDYIKSTADSSYITSSGQDSNAWGSGLLDIEKMIKAMCPTSYVSNKATVGDETLVFISNFTNEPFNSGTVILSDYDTTGVLAKTEYIPLSLEPYQTYELSLTKIGFSSNTVVRYVTDRKPGDANSDGEVNVRDVSVILRYLAGYNVGVPVASLDTNGDGEVSVRDASVLLRYLAGYEVVLY